MKSKIKALFFSGVALLGAPAFAHPGHDHEAWTSELMHALFYGSIAAVVVLAAGIYASKRTQNLNKKED